MNGGLAFCGMGPGLYEGNEGGVILTVVRLGHGFVCPYDAAQAFMSGGIMSTMGPGWTLG